MEIIQLKSKFMKGLMDQNTYVVLNDKNAVIIDAGAEVEDVLKAVNGAQVSAILLTHLHFDHFWCIEEYISTFGCDVYICEGAEEKFLDSQKNGSTIVRKEIIRNVMDSNIKYYKPKLKLGNLEIEVFFTPGHCKDCVCLKIENILFSGDTLFENAIGRTDIYDSSFESMIESLRLIKNLNVDYIYPGHYNSFTKNQAVNVIDYFLR